MALEVNEFIKLTEDYSILSFSCGDDIWDKDLDDFLHNDAKPHYRELMSVTYVLEDNGCTAAFFSLLNDKVSIEDVDSKSQWKKYFQSGLDIRKKFKSYPAIKIGRLAVNKDLQGKGLGQTLLDYVKGKYVDDIHSGCMYITVDAYKKSVPFYTKNGFRPLSERDINEDTRLMYYDLSILLP